MVVTAAGVGLPHLALQVAAEDVAVEGGVGGVAPVPRAPLRAAEVEAVELVGALDPEEGIAQFAVAVLFLEVEVEGVLRVRSLPAPAAAHAHAAVDLEAGGAVAVDEFDREGALPLRSAVFGVGPDAVLGIDEVGQVGDEGDGGDVFHRFLELGDGEGVDDVGIHPVVEDLPAHAAGGPARRRGAAGVLGADVGEKEVGLRVDVGRREAGLEGRCAEDGGGRDVDGGGGRGGAIGGGNLGAVGGGGRGAVESVDQGGARSVAGHHGVEGRVVESAVDGEGGVAHEAGVADRIVRCTGGGGEEVPRGGVVAEHAVADVLELLGVVRVGVLDRDSVGADEGEIAARVGVEGEGGVIGVGLARGEEADESVGRQDRTGRYLPAAGGEGLVGEKPPAQVEGRGGRIEKFEPVGGLSVDVVEGVVVVGHELGDDRSGGGGNGDGEFLGGGGVGGLGVEDYGVRPHLPRAGRPAEDAVGENGPGGEG